MLPIEMVQMTNQSHCLQCGRHHGWAPAHVSVLVCRLCPALGWALAGTSCYAHTPVHLGTWAGRGAQLVCVLSQLEKVNSYLA